MVGLEVMNDDPLSLIEYWSIDPDYDGTTFRSTGRTTARTQPATTTRYIAFTRHASASRTRIHVKYASRQ